MLSSIVEGPAAEFVEYLTQATDKTNGMNSPLTTMFNTIKGIVEFVKEYGSQLVFVAKILGIIKAAQIGYNIALGIGMIFEKQKTKELKKQGLISGIKAAFSMGASSFNPIAALAIITTGIAATYAAFAMFNKGGPVPGTNTATDSIPAMLTSGEYVIPNSNGKTGTEKYNEMISSKTSSTFNKGGEMPAKSNTEKYNEVIIPSKSNKGDSTQYSNLGGGGNSNQDSAALISAINGLRSDMKALASRPINTSVQIDGKEVVLAQGTYSKEKGDANRMESWQMS